MPNTFTLIASSTVGAGGASSISFTSIPSTYTDLCVELSLRGSTAVGAAYDPILLRFNGSTSGYSGKSLSADGATVYSGSLGTATSTAAGGTWARITDAGIPTSSQTANTFGNSEIYIPNYAGSSNKSYSLNSVEENNATTAWRDLAALLWSNTSAITQIDLALKDGSFVQYSTAYLYGVKNS